MTAASASAAQLAKELLGPLCPPIGGGWPVWMESVLPDGWEGPADRYVAKQSAAIAARLARDPYADTHDINPVPDEALLKAQREAVARAFLAYARERAAAGERHVWGVSCEHYGLVVGFVSAARHA